MRKRTRWTIEHDGLLNSITITLHLDDAVIEISEQEPPSKQERPSEAETQIKEPGEKWPGRPDVPEELQ